MLYSKFVRSSENLRQNRRAADQRLHASEIIGLKTAKHLDADTRTHGPMYRKDIFYSGSVVNLQRGIKLSDTATSSLVSIPSTVSVVAPLKTFQSRFK